MVQDKPQGLLNQTGARESRRSSASLSLPPPIACACDPGAWTVVVSFTQTHTDTDRHRHRHTDTQAQIHTHTSTCARAQAHVRFPRMLQFGKVLLEGREFGRLRSLVADLHDAIQPDSDADDDDGETKNGTQLMEVYALEIQMYTELKETKKLKVGAPCVAVSLLIVCTACISHHY